MISQHILAGKHVGHRVGMGIVQQDGNGILRRLGLAFRQRQKGVDDGVVADLQPVGKFLQRILFSGLHAGAGQNVMELTEKQVLFRLLQSVGGIGQQPVAQCLRRHFFRQKQAVFQPAMVLFDRRQRGIAADEDGIEPPPENRQAALLQLGKKTLRYRMADVYPPAVSAHERFNIPQILIGRPAPVVTDSPKPQEGPFLSGSAVFLYVRFNHSGGIAAGRVVAGVEPMAHDGAAIVALPYKILRKIAVLRCGIGPHKQIAGVAGLMQQLDNPPGMAEGIRVKGNCGRNAEFFPEVPPSG